MDYLTYDIETTYGKSNGRVGNRWDDAFGLCSIGWKLGKGEYEDRYTVSLVDNQRVGRRPDVGLPFPNLDDVNYLVGHNIKFDLLWYWDHPELVAFIKRGGKIWDTMYAEYILSGQFYNFHNKHPGMGLNLKETAKRRGCKHQKLDMVAALWDDGVRTEDVPEDILLEYQKYDVLTTEEIFLSQVAQAREQGQTIQIQQRMEGLIATTEMEFNGMYIDQEVAAKQQAALEDKIAILSSELDESIPALPSGCEFKWSSWRNVSALIFGGNLKYTGIEYSLDEHGAKQYYQLKVRKEILDANGVPVRFKGGKNAGKIKTKLYTIPDLERGAKTRQCDMYFGLPGFTEPETKWASKSAPGYFSTAGEIMDILAGRGVAIATHVVTLKGYIKDLGTYYKKCTVTKSGKETWTGMLTNIQPDGCVHGSLNHTVVVTTRLSSSNPNLQNIPKEGKSDVKKCFTSRFPDGVVSEIDYAQLEVVCKGVLSGDKNLLRALQDGVDEHCEWLSFATGVPYEEVIRRCKVEKDPLWIKKRQNIKSLTFQEKYGAGVPKLASSSGLDADTVKAAMAARRLKYPDMYKYDEDVEDEVNRSRTVTNLRTDEGYQKAIGYYRSPTNTIFHFLEGESHDWQKDQGIFTAFQQTCIKNYPSQGLGGEIMQVQSGRVTRKLFEYSLTDRIKLMNTVHDSVYLDFFNPDVAERWLPAIGGLLEDVSMYFNLLYDTVAWDTPFPVDVDYGLNIMETNTTIKERTNEWIL